jgi:hypothetical protein
MLDLEWLPNSAFCSTRSLPFHNDEIAHKCSFNYLVMQVLNYSYLGIKLGTLRNFKIIFVILKLIIVLIRRNFKFS